VARPPKQAQPVPLPEEATGLAKPAPILELEQLAEAGDGAAACRIGEHYRTGDIVTQDWAMTFHWYSRGAELGDPAAQNNLGTMFLEGLGCKCDTAQAVHWYRKSAEQGPATAQYNLAKRYDFGDGIEQNSVEARKWYEKAAVQGYTDASREVGTIYQYGQGVPRNLLAAAEYHLIAAEERDDLAIGSLSRYRGELEEMALSGSQLASLFLSRICPGHRLALVHAKTPVASPAPRNGTPAEALRRQRWLPARRN
jgi:TPR repeat protein